MPPRLFPLSVISIRETVPLEPADPDVCEDDAPLSPEDEDVDPLDEPAPVELDELAAACACYCRFCILSSCN